MTTISVLALLDRQAAALVQRTLGAPYVVRLTPTPGDFDRQLRRGDVDVVVLDPNLLPGDDASSSRTLTLPPALATLPLLPVVVFATPSHRAFVGLARLMGATRRVRLVVCCGTDDIAHLRVALAEAVQGDAGEALLEQLREPLAALDHRLAASIAALFRGTASYRSVPELARAVGSSPRSIHRHLRAAGLGSAERIFSAVRILQLHALLMRRSMSITAAADALGYASTERLRALTGRVLGVAPSTLRRWTEGELVAALASRLTRAAAVRARRAGKPYERPRLAKVGA